MGSGHRQEASDHPGAHANNQPRGLSADGKHVVTGSCDKTAILWEAATAKKLQTFQGHTSDVLDVALSADGKQVVTGSNDGTAILWDAATGKKLQTFKGHTRDVTSVALSADTTLLVSTTALSRIPTAPWKVG